VPGVPPSEKCLRFRVRSVVALFQVQNFVAYLLQAIGGHIAATRVWYFKAWWVCPFSACPGEACGGTDVLRYSRGCRHGASYYDRAAATLNSGESYVDVEAVMTPLTAQAGVTQATVNADVLNALTTPRGQAVLSELQVVKLGLADGWITLTTPQPPISAPAPLPPTGLVPVTTDDGDSSSLPGYVIAIIVVGVLILVMAGILIWLLVCRRGKDERDEREMPPVAPSVQPQPPMDPDVGPTYTREQPFAPTPQKQYSDRGASNGEYTYSYLTSGKVSDEPMSGTVAKEQAVEPMSGTIVKEEAVEPVAEYVMQEPLQPRTRVEGQWGDTFYAGQIVEQQPDGNYMVLWDDGSHSPDVSPETLRVL